MATATATKLSASDIANAMRKAGWPETAIPVGVAVALAESGGNPTAVNRNNNGSTDYGLFQINTVHGSLLQQGDWSNPVDNSRMALTVWKNAGSKWTPWVAYNSGSYKKFTQAVTPGTEIGPDGTVWTPVPTPGLTASDPLGLGAVWNAFVSPELWRKVMIFLLAVFLIIAGTIVILRRPIATGIKAGTKVYTKGLV